MALLKNPRRVAVGLLVLALSSCAAAWVPKPGDGGASAPPPWKRDPRQDPQPKPEVGPKQVDASHQTVKDLANALGKMASAMEKSPGFQKGDANAVRVYRRLLELMANLQRDLDRNQRSQAVQLSADTLKSISAASLDLSRLMLDGVAGPKSVLKPISDRFDALSDLDDGMQRYLSGQHDGATIEKLSKGSLALITHQVVDAAEKAAKQHWRIDQLQREVTNRSQRLQTLEDRLANTRRPQHADQLRVLIKRLRPELDQRLADLEQREAAVAKAVAGVRLAALLVDPAARLAKVVVDAAQGRASTVQVADQTAEFGHSLLASALVIPMLATPATAVWAPAVREVLFVGIQVAGKATEGNPFDRLLRHEYMRLTGERFALLDRYLSYQAREVIAGRPVKLLDEYFTRDDLLRFGFRVREIDSFNAQARLYNADRNQGPGQAAPSKPQLAQHPPQRPEPGPLAPPRVQAPPPGGGMGGVTVNANPSFVPLGRAPSPSSAARPADQPRPGQLWRDRP